MLGVGHLSEVNSPSSLWAQDSVWRGHLQRLDYQKTTIEQHCAAMRPTTLNRLGCREPGVPGRAGGRRAGRLRLGREAAQTNARF